MSETLRALVERAIELLKHVNVLDCGAHHCRYCLAKSPQWEHTPSCPYAESQRLHTEAGELRCALSAALTTAQAAPGWRDIASAPKDGTPVLIYAKWCDGSRLAVAHWGLDPRDMSKGVWLSGYATTYQPEVVVAWMPLPAPPVAGPAERKE